MCRRANTSGLCYMSRDRISEETGWSPKTVSQAISELECSGRLVEVEGTKGRATRTFRVIPGGKNGQVGAPETTISTGQTDPQNPKLNQKENLAVRVQSSSALARRNRAVSFGVLVSEQVRTSLSE
ncbi:MAG: helix-turn-helix domain-containing protein [Pseudomonadota bacterium]